VSLGLELNISTVAMGDAFPSPMESIEIVLNTLPSFSKWSYSRHLRCDVWLKGLGPKVATHSAQESRSTYVCLEELYWIYLTAGYSFRLHAGFPVIQEPSACSSILVIDQRAQLAFNSCLLGASNAISERRLY
jgi:hypothetical protein